MQVENNPLLISVVLNNVFSYCRLQELKNCRTVCHLWNSECRPHIRSRAKTTFGDNGKETDQFTRLFNSSKNGYLPMGTFYFFGPTAHQVEKFFQDFSQSVENIRLNFWQVEVECSFLANLISTGRCSSLKELELKNLPKDFHEAERLSPIHLDKNPQILPNVKKLSLTHECSFGITLDLLKICPNMVTFKFGWSSNIRNQIRALSSLEKSRHSKIKKIKIKGVDIDFKTAKELLNLLINSEFRLKKLNFSRCTVEDQESQLGNLFSLLFQHQSKNLQKLALPAPSCGQNLEMTFPQMEILRKIAFSANTIRFSFPNLSQYFPKLQILDLKKFNINNFQLPISDIFARREITPSSNFELHSLMLPAGLTASHAHFVNKLAEIFQFVENITVHFEEPEILESLWTGWPKLTGLDLAGPSNAIFRANMQDKCNASYLGIDPFDCWQINRTLSYKNLGLVIDRIKPSIVNLKDLTTLKISSNFLTDITPYLGISMLKKLKNLDLNCPNFTRPCLNDLLQHLPLLTDWNWTNADNAEM